MYLWGVRVEREDLELYRVEPVNRYRGLGIRIQVFIKLLEDAMDLCRRLGVGEESRFFLMAEDRLIHKVEGIFSPTSQAVKTRLTFRTTGS